ncbi:MAG: hypothetical protein ACU84H_06630 [Gammaproteobacteria bacterium]
MKSEKVDGSVVSAMLRLQPDHIPKHLMQMNPVKAEGDFDPNAYFTILTHLSMKQGYTLDYVYHYMHDFGGNPYLYARAVDEPPLVSYNEYQNLDWKLKIDPLFFLVADDTPDGFFQLAVFRQLAGQFYLYWHANYHDYRILTTPWEIYALISEVNGETNDHPSGVAV